MHVHFIAIGGTGMGSLAGLLKSRGFRVTGSDHALYPPMSTALEEWGIPVSPNFRPENILESPPDLVIIGNAVRPDNVEACAALKSGVPVSSFPDALYEHAIKGKHSIVVSGTHGKTTTTSLIGTLLHETGCDPSLLVGGVAKNFDGGFRDGEGPHFVVEGDEYDTAFFDKTPKFLHYYPETLVVTSVEFDHADIYRDLDSVKSAFVTLVKQMPSSGLIVASSSSPSVGEVVQQSPCQVISYGACEDRQLTFSAQIGAVGPSGTEFQIRKEGKFVTKARFPGYGRHNVENALAALIVVSELGIEIKDAAKALETFRGVKRRLEVIGEIAGAVIIDDFAHHPTAVAETLAALRDCYPGRRIVAVFEPRSNTSRRDVFQKKYVGALSDADRTIVSVVPETVIYNATSDPVRFFSSEKLADDLRGLGRDAIAIDGVDLIVEDLLENTTAGDVIVTLSNGDFGGIWGMLLAGLKARGL